MIYLLRKAHLSRLLRVYDSSLRSHTICPIGAGDLVLLLTSPVLSLPAAIDRRGLRPKRTLPSYLVSGISVDSEP